MGHNYMKYQTIKVHYCGLSYKETSRWSFKFIHFAKVTPCKKVYRKCGSHRFYTFLIQKRSHAHYQKR